MFNFYKFTYKTFKRYFDGFFGNVKILPSSQWSCSSKVVPDFQNFIVMEKQELLKVLIDRYLQIAPKGTKQYEYVKKIK